MKEKKKVWVIGSIIIIALLIIGCLCWLLLSGGKKAKLLMELDGNTYDLWNSPQELLGELDDNGVWLIDTVQLDTYKKHGIVENELAHVLNPGVREKETVVSVSTSRFPDKDLVPKEDTIESIISSAVKLHFLYSEKAYRHGFAIGEDITAKKDKLSDYFDIRKSDFTEILDMVYEGKDKELDTLEELDAACILPGYRVLPYQRPRIAAVYFDKKQVDILDYAVEDVADFFENRDIFYVSRVPDYEVAYVRREYGDKVSTGEGFFLNRYQDLSEEEQDGWAREAALENTIHQGILAILEGKVKQIRVCIIEDGNFTLCMYDADGKHLVFDMDDSYVFRWK